MILLKDVLAISRMMTHQRNLVCVCVFKWSKNGGKHAKNGGFTPPLTTFIKITQLEMDFGSCKYLATNKYVRGIFLFCARTPFTT